MLPHYARIAHANSRRWLVRPRVGDHKINHLRLGQLRSYRVNGSQHEFKAILQSRNTFSLSTVLRNHVQTLPNSLLQPQSLGSRRFKSCITDFSPSQVDKVKSCRPSLSDKRVGPRSYGFQHYVTQGALKSASQSAEDEPSVEAFQADPSPESRQKCPKPDAAMEMTPSNAERQGVEGEVAQNNSLPTAEDIHEQKLTNLFDEAPVTLDGKIMDKLVSALRFMKDWEAHNKLDSLVLEPSTYETSAAHRTALLQASIGKSRSRNSSTKSALKITTIQPQLPIRNPKVEAQILKSIRKSHVCIIKSATGSGKTTQIPQMIFDAFASDTSNTLANIVCTQPRKISTTSVAHRVAAERRQTLQVEVGYAVRYDSRPPGTPHGITYMTSGYLLRLILADPFATLEKYSHIILDEIHESDASTDLVMTALAQILRYPPETLHRLPKIILMSATLHPERLQSYFRSVSPDIVTSVVKIPGRSHPVSGKYLEDVWYRLQTRFPEAVCKIPRPQGLDYTVEGTDPPLALENKASGQTTGNNDESVPSFAKDSEGQTAVKPKAVVPLEAPVDLLALMLADIVSTSNDGDVLVFLPGMAEIRKLHSILLSGTHGLANLNNQDQFRIFMLHSSMYRTNAAVFDPIPPGCRRIILATNIAETSITLPDVVFVLDTGLCRRNEYSSDTGTEDARLKMISKAEALQRRGRAGRVRPGFYLATYSSEQSKRLKEVPTPELQAMELDGVLLQNLASPLFHATGPDVQDETNPGDELQLAPYPPDPKDVRTARERLCQLGALTNSSRITPMGKFLGGLACEPVRGRSLLYGIAFRCLDPVLFFASCHSGLRLVDDWTRSSAEIQGIKRKFSGFHDHDTYAVWKMAVRYSKELEIGSFKSRRLFEEQYGFRRDSFHNVARGANDFYDSLRATIGTQWRVNTRNPRECQRLPRTMPQLNTNSKYVTLIKALALSSAYDNVAFSKGSTSFYKENTSLAIFADDVNFDWNKSVMNRTHHKRCLTAGNILSYSSLLDMVTGDNVKPLASDTGVHSPLQGMLFCQSLSLDEFDRLVINDLQPYRIEIVGKSTVPPAKAATLIHEFRKALNRFLSYCLLDINEKTRKQVWLTLPTNNMLSGADHPLRQVITDTLIDILNIDEIANRAKFRKRIMVEALAGKIQPEDENVILAQLDAEAPLFERGASRDAKQTRVVKRLKEE